MRWVLSAEDSDPESLHDSAKVIVIKKQSSKVGITVWVIRVSK